MKLKNYISPSVNSFDYVASAICAATQLEGSQVGGGGGSKDWAPARRLYV